jgi:hypothetical protein
MKSIIRTCGLATLGCILPLAAQVTETTETTETSRSATGAVTETTTTTQTFNPEARTKVVTHFETYKTNPYGLPPGLAAKIQVKKIPPAWRTTRISPGVVVTEEHRPYLVEAPAEIVKVLPAPSTGVRYYVAGSNVVAVDSTYKVIDSVQIPSIKYTDDGDEIEIESKQGGKTKKVEIDKDDGEVDVDVDD